MAETDEVKTESTATEDGPACTLPAESMAERAEWIDETLEPHLLGVSETDSGLVYRFERSAAVYEAVSDLLWKEADCCAFATHDLRVPADGDRIEWHWAMDEAGTDVLREASERFDVLEVPS